MGGGGGGGEREGEREREREREGGRERERGHWRKRDDCHKLHTTNTVSNTQYTKITVSMLTLQSVY